MPDFEKAFRRESLLDAEDMGGGVLRFSVEYVGNHPLYINKCVSDLILDQENLFLKELDLHVPYSALKEITTIDQDHVDFNRILAFGIYGALVKDKITFLRLVYNDGIMDQTLILKSGFVPEIRKEIYLRFVKTTQPQK